jgi:hypothetical protein
MADGLANAILCGRQVLTLLKSLTPVIEGSRKKRSRTGSFGKDFDTEVIIVI